MSTVPQGREIRVALAGFAATLTEYVPIYGYSTAYVDNGPYYYHGRHGHGHFVYGGGHYETVTSRSYVPQTRSTDAFLKRAEASLEESGFLLRAAPVNWTVDVTFSGPFTTSQDRTLEWTWMLCSIFSAEYSTQTWTAKLKIYDSKTGKLVFHRDYSQKFEDVVWSPFFFIGLAGYDENTANFMQSWCLTALTDRALADTTAFLVQH